MSKPKPALTAAKLAARELRIAITDQMRRAGPQTVQQLAVAIGREADEVRGVMCNLVKNGHARSRRESSPAGLVARYSLSDPAEHVRNVAKPNRPVLKEWPVSQVRDPMALPAAFFGGVRTC